MARAHKRVMQFTRSETDESPTLLNSANLKHEDLRELDFLLQFDTDGGTAVLAVEVAGSGIFTDHSGPIADGQVVAVNEFYAEGYTSYRITWTAAGGAATVHGTAWPADRVRR